MIRGEKLKRIEFVLSIIFFILLFIYGAVNCLDNRNLEYISEQRDNFQYVCETGDYTEYEGDPSYLSYVQKYCANEYFYDPDFLAMYNIMPLQVITIPLIFIPVMVSLIYVNRVLKDTYPSNCLTRISYKKFLRKIFGKAYIAVCIVPLAILGIFIVGMIKYGVDPSYAIHNPTIVDWTVTSVFDTFWFVFLYLLNIVFYFSTYVNVGLIVSRKCRRFSISLILSFLILMGIQLFFEVFSPNLSFYNFMNFLQFYDAFGRWAILALGFVFCLISWIGVYFAYRSKEKLYLDCCENKE